jgi:NADH-quinone oxidoreductase subunit N
MSFQLTDFPRILPELMLVVLALLVLGSDVLERWSRTPEVQQERAKASAQLAALGLGLVFIVALVQSGYLFTVGQPLPGGGINSLLNAFINLGQNLQAAGPGGPQSAQPILGAFATDNLAMVARLTIIGAAFLTTLLTYDQRPTGSPGEFYALLLFATAGMCIMVAASELILAYVALELSSIALYVLAGYARSDERSAEAGMKYFLFGAMSSGILLYGMSLAYGFTASANSGGSQQVIGTLFASIGQASVRAQGQSTLLTLAMIFIVAGIGYKLAVVPFHAWAPDVYQGAPTLVTGFISTASKMAGFLLLYRLLSAAFPALAGTPGAGFTGWTSLLAVLALLTIIVGNLSALPQTNAKRLLAYSSISHAGFLLLALVLWSATPGGDRAFGLATLLYYLVVYCATNIGAFGVLAIVAQATGGDAISDLNGLLRRNAGLAAMLTVLVLSLAGIPPLGGFWAKLFVFMSAYRAGAVWLMIVAVLMTVVSLAYYLRLLKAMWFNAPASNAPLRTPRAMNAALMIATALVVLLGLFPNALWNVVDQVQVIAGR